MQKGENMEEMMKTILKNQGIILQIISGILADEDQKKQIFDYGGDLMRWGASDEQSGTED